MLVRLVAYPKRQESAMNMKINLTKRAAIRKWAASFSTSITDEWSTAVSWFRDENKRVLSIWWMFFDVTDSTGTMVMEKVVAQPARIYGFVAEPFAARAMDGLAFCHLVDLQLMMVAEVCVFHCKAQLRLGNSVMFFFWQRTRWCFMSMYLWIFLVNYPFKTMTYIFTY